LKEPSWPGFPRREFEGDIRGHAARLAAKLAKAGALIPWLADELEANGWERRLIELLGDRDGKEIHPNTHRGAQGDSVSTPISL
jgi:hypothetical protein